MKSPLTTLCYIEKDGQYLMLHRVSKDKDVNKGKWIGVGGHFEAGESPEECLLREVREETGLTLTAWQFRGMLTFESEGWPSEYICVYTADGFEGEPAACDEGELAWVSKDELLKLELWEGDRIFLRLLLENAPFFSLKLCYKGDELCYAALDGRALKLRGFDSGRSNLRDGKEENL
ncbi:MAG: 8-oxo-dGTP diphosphatase [Lachnospiraceae bacterium]|nr:8-oxo-dGTP diphosphatase [Lachnospiraceae bacterium]